MLLLLVIILSLMVQTYAGILHVDSLVQNTNIKTTILIRPYVNDKVAFLFLTYSSLFNLQ